MNANYELFGLSKKTTMKELEQSKRKTLLELHPDKHPGEEEVLPAYQRLKETLKEKLKEAPKEAPKEPQTIDEWFIQKLKFPNKYNVNPDGDLTMPSGKVFELNPQVPANTEYIKQQLSKRNEGRKEAEIAYTVAKRELLELIQGYNSSSKTTTDASIIMIANQKVFDAESILNSYSKEPRVMNKILGLREKDLHIEEHYNASKIPDTVSVCLYGTYPWSYFWMNNQEQIPEPEPELESNNEQQGGKREKTPEEKARIWAIIRAKKVKASFK